MNIEDTNREIIFGLLIYETFIRTSTNVRNSRLYGFLSEISRRILGLEEFRWTMVPWIEIACLFPCWNDKTDIVACNFCFFVSQEFLFKFSISRKISKWISSRDKFINDNFDDNEYYEFPRNLKLIKQRFFLHLVCILYIINKNQEAKNSSSLFSFTLQKSFQIYYSISKNSCPIHFRLELFSFFFSRLFLIIHAKKEPKKELSRCPTPPKVRIK